MAPRVTQLQRFFYSHYFFGGLRQSLGVLLPALVLIGVFHLYAVGVIIAIGAACVAIIDQPGGPRRNRRNEMLGGLLLVPLTAAVTGLASPHPVLLWFVIPAMCFGFSMLTVYGKRGGLIGFACLLMMTLTMRTPLDYSQVLQHTLYSFLGGVFYFVFSYMVSLLLWYREEQQGLSVALFATADYMAARSQFYDINIDLDACYRRLIHFQSVMTEKHQAARDLVLRELPRGGDGRGERHRVMLLNIFIDMIDLLDSLVATHTDYATLRRRLPDSDVLIFARDALYKLSTNLATLALNIARNKGASTRSSVRAELRAIEYELEQYRNRGLAREEPEVYALLVQILRRLRNATRVIERMAARTRGDAGSEENSRRLDKSLTRFLSRQELRFGMITSNLRLSSSHFRYALRVTIATLMAMTATTVLSLILQMEDIKIDLTAHSYWIVLTIIIVMKPGFALTRQRNGWRLMGTVIGCVLGMLLFTVTHNPELYLAAMLLTSILGYALVQVNYTLAAIFNTLFVLIVFHFLTPGTTFVVGERLADTLLGCALALPCSYILPWWERNAMRPLALAAQRANEEYLKTGLQYAALQRQAQAAADANAATTDATADAASQGGAAAGAEVASAGPASADAAASSPPAAGVDAAAESKARDMQLQDAELAWQLARNNVHIAFANFAAAFYRMMDEPASHQKNVPELNNMLIQNHVLASQISAAIPILGSLHTVPEGVQKSLEAIESLLAGRDAEAPASLETEGELAALAYPLRQMAKAAQLIHREILAVQA
ncbi:FUSC family protein [Candidimonas humi]|uniref:FUSC family membrane protein n=1 Tax=Candidimonas humi TaxID=683355 RepID=A0ABV8NYB6_9BURK|nr:FUSC family protein [Candidimonas humi]MBV6305111.1 FUSC family protein [Candidimonas humi]